MLLNIALKLIEMLIGGWVCFKVTSFLINELPGNALVAIFGAIFFVCCFRPQVIKDSTPKIS